MEIIFVLLPITLLLALIGVGAYFWSVRSGQFDDLDTPALKPLIDGEQVVRDTKPGSALAADEAKRNPTRFGTLL